MLKKSGILIIAILLVGCKTLPDASDVNLAKQTKAAKINAQLSMSYSSRGDYLRAKQKILLAMEEGPSLPEVWYGMAYYQEKTGDRAEAEKNYQKAIALDPKRGESHNNYGTYLCKQGQYRAAVKEFALAVKDINYMNTAGAYENAGLCALKIPDKTLARNNFERAIMIDPNLTTAAILLAQLNRTKQGN